VIDRIMARFKVNLLQVHNRGVRDGLVLTMIDQSSSISTDDPQQREAALERFAMACSGEPAHGRHVAKLAGKIFTQLAEPFGLAVADQPYLEAAARLQDVGYLINYDQHHKHSYHLILNSNLSGFRPRELELIANVARYHRGAYPKQKHDNFRQLPPEDQQRVRQLASILRIAGGLDRSHSQQVTDVELQWQASDKAVPRLTLLAKAAENPEVDIWGARRRVEMFETVFNCKLEIEWLDKSQAHNSSSNHAGENGSEAKSALRSESA